MLTPYVIKRPYNLSLFPKGSRLPPHERKPFLAKLTESRRQAPSGESSFEPTLRMLVMTLMLLMLIRQPTSSTTSTQPTLEPILRAMPSLALVATLAKTLATLVPVAPVATLCFRLHFYLRPRLRLPHSLVLSSRHPHQWRRERRRGQRRQWRQWRQRRQWRPWRPWRQQCHHRCYRRCRLF